MNSRITFLRKMLNLETGAREYILFYIKKAIN